MVDNKESLRKNLGIVIVGHVDAGKSTTTGRLLYELGNVSERELEKLEKQAKLLGHERSKWAHVTDKSKKERETGQTIQCTSKQFITKNFNYTIIDAPGHSQFIKNMLSGASQADVGILMVPANKGGFEASIARGNHKRNICEGSTRAHARLLNLLGIEQLIVCINKMDDISVNYSKKRFNEIKQEISLMLTKIGYKINKIPFIPISGFNGDNLIHRSTNMKWYNGFKVKSGKDKVACGHTLLDGLDNVFKPPKRKLKKEFILPISGIYKIKGVGDIITGRIESGKIKLKENEQIKVRFYPLNISASIKSIEMHNKRINKAIHGDNIGLNIKGLKSNLFPKIGDVMVLENELSDKHPIVSSVDTFSSLIYVQDHPNKIKIGFTPIVHVRTAKSPCKIIDIKWKISKLSNNQKITSPTFLENGDQALVIFKPEKPIIVSQFKKCKPFGRIACMNSNKLVMLGKIENINEQV